MRYNPDGFLGQVWQHDIGDGSTLSLLFDKLGRWELARVVDGKVVGNPQNISPKEARETLNGFEPGSGNAFFAGELRGELRKMQVELFKLKARMLVAKMQLEKLED